MSKNTPPRTPMEEAALAVYYHAARRIKDGRSPDEIERELVNQGIKRETARLILARLAQAQINVARRRALRDLLLGLFLIAVGMAAGLNANVFSMPLAVIFMSAAAVLAGVWWLLRGIAGRLKWSKSAPLPPEDAS